MRNHTYHVMTPVNRYENIRPMVQMLGREEVQWHIVYDSSNPVGLTSSCVWISTMQFENPYDKFWDRCNASLNSLINEMEIKDDDRYCFLNDDDAYEPGFFDKVDAHPGEVVMVSMLRGHQTPAGVAGERAHGTDTLVADPYQMEIGRVSVEQIIMSGRVLKKTRLPLHICGDGMMIEYVTKTQPVTYAPDCFVWFNYYEPGRWNK